MSSSRPLGAIVSVVGVAMLSALVMAVTPSAEASDSSPIGLIDETGEPIDSEHAEYFARVREGFGFPSSLQAIQDIIEEHGVAFEWGFPLLPGELDELERRLALADHFSDDVVLGYEELSGFAGFYYDHSNGGRPTLLVTEPQAGVVATELTPASVKDDLVVVQVAHDWELLKESVNLLAASGDPIISSNIHSVSIDVRENGLKVWTENADETDDLGARILEFTEIPFRLIVEPVNRTDACSSRENCHSPFRGGIRLDGNGSGSLGFAISHPTDKQYLTAGHFTGSTYSHYIYNVGSTAESEYFNGGADMRAIYASDSQVSDDIYITSTFFRDVKGSKYPSVGLPICMTGWKNLSCGEVVDNYKIYNTPGASSLLGASGDYFSQSGDSGAPLYQISGSSGAYAVGIHSAGSGDREFARIYDAPGMMGAFILTS